MKDAAPFRLTVALFLLIASGGSPGLAQFWVETTPQAGPQPPARVHAASVYDPVNHRMVIFGGATESGDANDVWALDLSNDTWIDLTPSSGPAPAGRFTANGVYDPVNHQMLVWAGQGNGDFFNDVWAFDLDLLSWAEFLPPNPEPNIRYGTAAVFDPVARDLVTFAGFTDEGRFDDTWRFDADAVAWTDVSQATFPPRRCLHSACYDSTGHRMIIYGGQQSGALDDIWELDLATDTWTDRTPEFRPSGRYFTANVYDSNEHRAVIFGGQGSGVNNEVWVFDLATGLFEQLFPSGLLPDERLGSTGVFIEDEGRMVVFGGIIPGQGRTNQVWSLNDLSSDLGCRVGNVNAAVGPIADVVFVNDSSGIGNERSVQITPTTPFQLRIDGTPENRVGPVQFALYAFAREPSPSTVRILPLNAGTICMPIPFTGGGPPNYKVLWNNIGKENHLGAATRPSDPAPTLLLDIAEGVGLSGTFFVQGLILDSSSIQGQAAVTNGVMIVSEE